MVRVFLTMLYLGGSVVAAADPVMRVSLADGGVMLGVLSASSEPRQIQIRSECSRNRWKFHSMPSSTAA